MNFSCLRVFLCLVVLQWAGIARAEEFFWLDGKKSHMVDLDGAKKVLGPAQHEKYLDLLKQKKCDEAISFLNKGFVIYYPQFSHATEDEGRSYRDWRVQALPDFYPEADLCRSLQQLPVWEKRAVEKQLPLGVYQLGRRRQDPRPENYKEVWWGRDLTLSGIFDLAVEGYHPALPEIAKLYRRGDIFEAGPEAEYYLLKRACHFGIKCKELTPRIIELERLVPTDVQKDMTERAARKEFDFKAAALD